MRATTVHRKAPIIANEDQQVDEVQVALVKLFVACQRVKKIVRLGRIKTKDLLADTGKGILAAGGEMFTLVVAVKCGEVGVQVGMYAIEDIGSLRVRSLSSAPSTAASSHLKSRTCQ